MAVTIPSLPPRPAVNAVADRIFDRLPEAYRTFDATGGYPLLYYIDAVTTHLGDIDTLLGRIAGARPVGPARPEPWSLHEQDVDDYRAAREHWRSHLGDPVTADRGWLPWLVQMVGGTLNPAASEKEQRDTVRYATSGWLAGTRRSMENAARSSLTGSQYARVSPHTLDDGSAGTEWDVTIVTRNSETPDPAVVLDAVRRKGVKPAGVVLWHRPYEAPWDTLEAVRTTWDLWEEDFQGFVSWDRLQETGLTYADVPGNILANSSFEENVLGWTAGPNTTQAWAQGGVDGFGHATLTANAAGQVSHQSDAVSTADEIDYRMAVSLQPAVDRVARMVATFSDGTTQTGPDHTIPGGVWTRLPQVVVTVPPLATSIAVSVQIDALAAGESVAVDAWDARRYTGGDVPPGPLYPSPDLYPSPTLYPSGV